VVTIGLVAANTAAMSIRERRAEIAVMRAIGFPSSAILSVIVAESVSMALVGGVFGCGAAYLTFKLFSVGTDAIGPLSNIHVSSAIVGETMLLAALLGTLSALIPAYAAARHNIVDALRLVA